MKKLSIVLAFVMLVSFVACSSQSEAPAQTTTGAITTKAQTSAVTTTAAATTTTTKADATTEVQNPFAEKMTINWLVGTYSSHLYEEGRWDELELEEKFNVDIKMWNILVDSNNMEQVQMMLAAGDVPDYGFYYTTGKYMYDNGLGRTIPLKMIQQYYPSYYKLIQEDPLGLSFNLVEGTTDEYYGLALYTPLSRHTGWVPMWRLDWLENLGYEMDNLTVMVSALNPDRWNDRVYFSTTKFTVDEVEELLRAFTEDDPDGNGVDDTYGSPFANSAYDRYISYNMFGFDQDASHFYKDPVTGDYVPYFAYTPYKDNLSFLMRMLDKGYMRWIPGELAYHLELRAIWNTGKVGFMNTLGAPRVLGLGYSDGNEWPPANILNNVDPNATFVITPVPGENGNFRPHQAFNWSAMMYLVGNVSDEKLARIFQMIEYAYFGEDWMRYKWGIEGVHYQWSGESMNSPIIFTDPEKIPPKYAGKGTTAFGQFGNLNFIDNINVYFNFDAFYIQFIEYWNQYSPDGWFGDSLWILPDKLYSQYTMPADKYEEFTELRNETNSQINTVHSEFTKRVWGGQISNIDSEWEQYIDQIYAAGLSEWVKFWNSDDIKTYNYYRQQK
jgi:putative aldouronate transport system substrate-binding protein